MSRVHFLCLTTKHSCHLQFLPHLLRYYCFYPSDIKLLLCLSLIKVVFSASPQNLWPPLFCRTSPLPRGLWSCIPLQINIFLFSCSFYCSVYPSPCFSVSLFCFFTVIIFDYLKATSFSSTADCTSSFHYHVPPSVLGPPFVRPHVDNTSNTYCNISSTMLAVISFLLSSPGDLSTELSLFPPSVAKFWSFCLLFFFSPFQV